MIPITIKFIFWIAQKLGLLKFEWFRKQKEFYFNYFQDKKRQDITEEKTDSLLSQNKPEENNKQA